MTAARDLAELTVALTAEHAVIYGYGVLGARLTRTLRREALSAFDAHRVRRDQLAARIRERGGDPPVAAAAYQVTVADQPAALALAVRLEDQMSVRWRDLLRGTDDPALRALALAGLTDSAVRAAGWRVRADAAPVTTAFPGA